MRKTKLLTRAVNLYCLVRPTILLLIIMVLGNSHVMGQTNPTAQALPYSQNFGALTHASTTYPAGWQGWTICTATCSNTAYKTNVGSANEALVTLGDASMNASAVYNYNGKLGILMANGNDVALALALNTTGFTSVVVNYDIMTIRNPYNGAANTRIGASSLQYRVGTSGVFTDLAGLDYQNNTTLQNTAVTTPQNLLSRSITLPAACNNQAVVQIRWVQRDVSGAGARASFAVDNISITGTGSACTGTPAPGNTNSTANPVCSGASFTLGFSGTVTGTGLTYQWQSSPNNSTWTNISGATSSTYAATQTTATYYRCLVTCSGNTGISTALQVAINTPGNCVCIGTYTNDCSVDYISNVTFATINRTSTCDGVLANNNRTYYNTPNPVVYRGNSYNLSVTTDGDDEAFRAWIDYDQNGAFIAGESVLTAGVTAPPATTSGSVTIPLTATLGETILRVRCRYNAAIGGGAACNAFDYGETEDYLITIADPPQCSGTPVAGNAVASTAFVCAPSGASTLSLSGAVADLGISFQWQSSPDSTTWSNIGGATGVTYAATVTSNTFYRCVLTCINGGASASSGGVKVTVGTCVNMVNGSTTLCDGAFFDSQGPTTNYLNNEDYTYTIYPNTGNKLSITFVSFSTEDGIDELEIFDGNSTSAPSLGVFSGATNPGTFTSSATDGSFTFHFVSDVSVRDAGWRVLVNCIPLPGCTGTIDAGNTVGAFVCTGASYTVSLSGQTSGASGITYQWQSSPDNITYTNISGAGSASYTITASSATWYRCEMTCSASSSTDISTPAQVTIKPAFLCSYCVVTGIDCSAEDVITNVTLGTLNNSSACSGSGYSDYTSNQNIPSLSPGSSYPMSVTVGAGGTEYVGVWIDYNHSGTFDATEFTALGSANGATINGTIAVPTSPAASGITAMRVRVRYNTALTGADACLTYTYGEAEDYLVDVQPATCILAPTYPANGGAACAFPTGTVLEWPAFPGATQYDVYFGTTPTPTTLVADDLAALSYNVGTLSTSGTYYWIIVPQISGATTCNTWSFTVNPVPTVVINSNSPACEGSSLTFSSANSASGQGSGNTYAWTGPNSFVSALQTISVSAVAANSGLYNVTITNQFACTASSSSQGDIAPNPSLTIDSQSDITCYGYNDGAATIVAANGTPDYLFNDGSNFNLDGIFTGMVPGVTTIYVEDANGCTNSIDVTINEPTTVAPVASSNTPVCINGTVNFTGSASGGVGSFSYSWSGPASYASTLQNPSISLVALTMAGDYFLTATDNNGCSNTTSTNLFVRDVPSAPAAISGAPVSVCPPTSAYTLSTSATDADTYNWYLAPSSNSVNFISANGSSTMDVDFQTTTNSGYTIRVEAINACGSSVYTPVFVRRSTSTPAAVIGDAFACANDVKTYSHVAIAGATSYQWTAPAGCYFDGNALNISPYTTTGTSVSITFPSGYAGGIIGVASQVACFTSPAKNITVNNAPPVVSVISGATTVCAPQSGMSYSVVNTAGLTYTWTAPANAVVFSGQGTNNIVVNYLNGFAGGQLQVVANSACGSAPARKLNVGVTSGGGITPRPVSITGTTANLCSNSNVLFTANPLVSGATYTFTSNIPGVVINQGAAVNEALISFPAGWAVGQISVTQQNACASVSLARTLDVKARPASPIITGPVNVAPNSTGVSYSVPVVSPAVTYTWYVPSGASIASGQGTPSVTVNFGSTGGQIKCFETNACGNATGVLNVASPRLAYVVANDGILFNELSVYPNPVKDNLTVKLAATTFLDAKVSITDLRGKEVIFLTVAIAEGINSFNIPVKNLASGMYLLSIQTPEGNTQTRIIVE